jgi:hypothetical protein
MCTSDKYILNLYNDLHNYALFSPTTCFDPTMALLLGSFRTIVSQQYGVRILQRETFNNQ